MVDISWYDSRNYNGPYDIELENYHLEYNPSDTPDGGIDCGSLLNYLMVGHLYESFKVHEGMEIRPRFTGLGRIISPDTNTVNIVVFHSSCLGPGFTWDTRSEDMLQFISGKFPEWFSHFKENCYIFCKYQNFTNAQITGCGFKYHLLNPQSAIWAFVKFWYLQNMQ